MRRLLLSCLLANTLLVNAALCATATISGRVDLSSAPFAGVGQVVGAQANCAFGGNGNYSCTVTTPYNGTIAAFADGFNFVVPSYTFTDLTTNQTNVDFVGTPAFGVRAELGVFRSNQFLLDFNFDPFADFTVRYGLPGDIPVVGDVDGDGISDLAVYRGGSWFIDTSSTQSAGTFSAISGQVNVSFDFGGPGDIPLLADMDGDGKAEAVIFRNGVWYVRSGAAAGVYVFGQAGDIPLLGDFNGDGKIDFAVYRGGVWYFDFDRNGSVDAVLSFGLPNDIPVALDYNGDGRADLAVFRNGQWFISVNFDGQLTAIVNYGVQGDRPVAGFFNRANTLFVKAGSACTTGCTHANPYGSIFAAWEEANPGTIIRIQAGTYTEAGREGSGIVFYSPLVQYAPGKFGKDKISLIGVSKSAVVISPPTGDALFIQAGSGYFLRNLTLTSRGSGGRGLVLVGGPPSYGLKGSHVNAAVVDMIDNDAQNALFTGASNGWLRYNRFNSSLTSNGLSLWGFSYGRVAASEMSQNGYTQAATKSSLPAEGKGIDIREFSEGDVRRTVFDHNQKFGVIAVDHAKLNLVRSSVVRTLFNGVMLCGATGPDFAQSTLTENDISGNGTIDPNPGNKSDNYNGIEVNHTCVGNHVMANNTFTNNAGNGIFVGSGNVNLFNNSFVGNWVGATFWASDAMSTADTVTVTQGNLFQANRVQGLFGERAPGTSTRKVIATIGGLGAGQKNTFKDHIDDGDGPFYAIECAGPPTSSSTPLTSDFVCPAGGNTFINNTRNVSFQCPSSCQQ